MQPQELDTSYHDGQIKGDAKGMPDKGTHTGLNGDSYDADLNTDATNRMGKVSGTKSDSPFDNMPSKPD